MESNSTREMIDYSWTRRKKEMKRIETFIDTIEAFIDILNGALEVCLLFNSELRYSKSMRGVIFSILSVKEGINGVWEKDRCII